MNNRVIGVKKSRFSGTQTVPDGSTFDYVSNGQNFKIGRDALYSDIESSIVIPEFFFNNVQEMKDDVSLSVGDIVTTYGYNSPGDGGSNRYEIVVSGTGTADAGSFIDLAGSGLQAKGLFPGGIIIAEQFGVQGGDTGDQYAAVQSAIAFAAGREIIFGAGIYRIELPNNTPITPGANTTISGRGKLNTTLHVVPTAGAKTALSLFDLTNDGVTLQDFNIDLDPAVGDGGQFILLRANCLSFYNLKLDGGHTDVNTTTVHCFGLGSNIDAEDITIHNCEIHNWRFGMLKGNTDTSTQQNIKITCCYFHDNYANDLALNSPTGVINDVIIEGNTFRDSRGGAAFGTFGIMCGMASATNVRILGNQFQGLGQEAVHIEEAAQYVVVSGNTIAMDEADAEGIFITDNNIGAAATPEYISVVGNTVRGGSKTGTGTGIRLASDASGLAPASFIEISNNLITEFNRGISCTQEENVISIHHNTIQDCNEGIFCVRPLHTISDNFLSDCTSGVVATTGGLLGRIRIENVTTIATVTNGEISVDGWELYLQTNLPASTTTSVNLLTIGTVHYGILRAHWIQGGTEYRHANREITWDGTTLTDTNKVTQGAGLVLFSAVVNNGGQLAINLNNTNGTARNGGRLQVVYDGMYTF